MKQYKVQHMDTDNYKAMLTGYCLYTCETAMVEAENAEAAVDMVCAMFPQHMVNTDYVIDTETEAARIEAAAVAVARQEAAARRAKKEAAEAAEAAALGLTVEAYKAAKKAALGARRARHEAEKKAAEAAALEEKAAALEAVAACLNR